MARAPEVTTTLELSLKAVSDDGVFTGYASHFGEVDLGRDNVQAGAFTKSLTTIPAPRVKMLREHDQRDPIGTWDEIVEDEKGLKVTGRIVLDTTKGRETHALMKAGALDGLSIGYRTKASRFDKAARVRMLDEVELHEISVVTFPMLPTAGVTGVKSNEPAPLSEIAAAIDAARTKL